MTALSAPTLAKYQEITSPTGTTFVTSSWTPNASARLYLCWLVINISSGTVNAPTGVTGNGLTWSKVLDTTAADGSTRIGSLWAAYGTGTAGATTVEMGVAHASCIVAIYEQSGVTSTDAILQSATNRVFNTNVISVSLSAFGSSDNTCMIFAGVRGITSGGNTGIDPSSGMTELTEDEIDNFRQVFVAYQLSENTSPGLTLTGDSDGVYTSHHIWAVAIEIGAAVTPVAKVEIVIDIDPADLDEEEATPPDAVPVPGSASGEPTPQQASTARPRVERSQDLATIVAAAERKADRAIAHANSLFGHVSVEDTDPADPADGRVWVRSSTGELCWVAGGVVQVLQPSTPILEENG